MEKLFVAGIDPGTVQACALLDLEGNFVYLHSARNQSFEQMIKLLRSKGKVFLIGSDVKPCPYLVKKIARSLGAKILEPDHNLLFFEKIKLVDTFLKEQKKFIKIQNQHEKDALAAAIHTLKHIRPLLKKLEDNLVQNNNLHLLTQIQEKVLLEDMAINKAVMQVTG